MLWHRQAIFESTGDWLSSSDECGIRSWEVWDTKIASRSGSVISSQTLLGMWLLVHAGIDVNPNKFMVKGALEKNDREIPRVHFI